MSAAISLSCDNRKSDGQHCKCRSLFSYTSLDELRAADARHGWLVSANGEHATCPHHGMWRNVEGAPATCD